MLFDTWQINSLSLSLSAAIVDRYQFFKRLGAEKLLSAVALEAGTVRRNVHRNDRIKVGV